MDKNKEYELDICDLHPDKLCDNCGECINLNIDGYESKVVEISSIVKDDDLIKDIRALSDEEFESVYAEDEGEEYDFNELLEDDYTTEADGDEYLNEELIDHEDAEIDYIEDIDGLGDLLKDEVRKAGVMEEVYPGFFRIVEK